MAILVSVVFCIAAFAYAEVAVRDDHCARLCQDSAASDELQRHGCPPCEEHWPPPSCDSNGDGSCEAPTDHGASLQTEEVCKLGPTIYTYNYSGEQQPYILPHAEVALLFLLHEAGFPNDYMFEEWLAMPCHANVAAFCHMKAGVDVSVRPGERFIKYHALSKSYPAHWGQMDLVEATIHSMAEILQRGPNVKHMMVMSGHHVPIHVMTRTLGENLGLKGVSEMQEMYPLREDQVDAVRQAFLAAGYSRSEANKWAEAAYLHHQWKVLTREHAKLVVDNMDLFVKAGRIIQAALRTTKDYALAPDEHVIGTGLRYLGKGGEIGGASHTGIVYPGYVSDHPLTWDTLDYKRCAKNESDDDRPYHASLRESIESKYIEWFLFFRKVDCPHAFDHMKLQRFLRGLWQDSLDWQQKPTHRFGPSPAVEDAAQQCPYKGVAFSVLSTAFADNANDKEVHTFFGIVDGCCLVPKRDESRRVSSVERDVAVIWEGHSQVSLYGEVYVSAWLADTNLVDELSRAAVH